MALSIRDGNQALTTLSTVLTGGQHVPAHTVVSLGSQAITDIAGAVSGVELGPNTLNALESITVTLGQVTITGGLTDAQLRASAVTIGGSVSISNFPATQTVTFTQASTTFGSITGNVSVLNLPSTQTVTFTQASVTFGATTGSVSVLNFPATQTVTFTTATITGSTSVLNFPATQTVTFSQASVTFSQASVTFGTPTVTGSVSILNLPATQTVTFTQASVTFGTAVITGSASILGTPSVTFTQASVTFGDIHGTVTATNTVLNNALQYDGSHYFLKVGGVATTGGTSFPVYVAGSVTVGNSVSISNFPSTQTIAGTVTANLSLDNNVVKIIDSNGDDILLDDGNLPISGTVTVGNSVTIGSLPAISGTVTANGGNFSTTDGNSTPPSTAVQIGWWNGNDEYNQVRPSTPFPIGIVGRYGPDSQISNGQLLSVQKTSDYYGISWDRYVLEVANVNSVTIGNSITIGSLPAISGTVTVGALPSGALTTRFGSVTTANTAQITSAVTNTSRKYLLAQNISAGTVTIGIGFSPTTTQGIQLTAGAGLTFDAFCPTGAVYWLGAVTGAAYTILEG